MESSFDFTRWTGAELARAEHTADRFLAENQAAIWESFARQTAVLGKLVGILKQEDLTLAQRLNLFARIAEVSDGMKHCANGFFELGCEPVVARVLSGSELL